jgi:transcriptional regulator with XRE-family HTH domain
MNIGEKIKQTRENQGLSMNQLAKKSGALQSTLSEIEAGKRQPTFGVLKKIISGFGLTLAEFFADTPPEFTPDERRLLEAYKALRADQKELVLGLTELLKKG